MSNAHVRTALLGHKRRQYLTHGMRWMGGVCVSRRTLARLRANIAQRAPSMISAHTIIAGGSTSAITSTITMLTKKNKHKRREMSFLSTHYDRLTVVLACIWSVHHPTQRPLTASSDAISVVVVEKMRYSSSFFLYRH